MVKKSGGGGTRSLPTGRGPVIFNICTGHRAWMRNDFTVIVRYRNLVCKKIAPVNVSYELKILGNQCRVRGIVHRCSSPTSVKPFPKDVRGNGFLDRAS